jgi:NADH-quinone oxidoreductase subunit M
LVLGNISFPGTFNFAGEFLIFISLFKINFVIPLLASSGMFLSAAYTLIMFNRLNNGNVSEEIDVMIDLNIIEFHFLFFLVSMVIFFGLFPNFIIKISYISVKILLLKNDLF